MTTYALRAANAAKTRADVVVVGLVQTRSSVEVAPGGEAVAGAYGRRLRPLLSSLGARGRIGEITKVVTAGTVKAPLLVLVGLGPEADLTAQVIRGAAGAAARAIPNAASVALALPGDEPAYVRAAIEGWALGGHTYSEFKSAAKSEPVGTVVVLSDGARKQVFLDAAASAQMTADAVIGVRDWVNTPPNHLRPPDFADQISKAVKSAAKELPRGARITVHVLDEVALAELGCGGILGVGMGSGAPPRLVEITYTPATESVAHLALVGKGVTFDSGGLTLKPHGSMTAMKSDMAGAAAVVAATLALARQGTPLKISCFVPLAENMLSGASYRPGDVLTMLDGRTVEVRNTDAEGRLILADALVRAAAVKPDRIIDVATLTGHMSIALGDRVAAIFGNDQQLVDSLVAAGAAAGETLWPMPISDEAAQRLHDSPIADLLQHDWIRWGGGLVAAAFLREFADGRDWAHLDIAGPAFLSGGPSGHLVAGGTGFGTATLIEYATSLAAGN